MIIFVGDIHGDFLQLADSLADLQVNNSFFIQVGDFGVGFKDKENEGAQLEIVNIELSKKGNVMYVIRGNHDDPRYFNGHLSYSNLHLLKDYSVLTLEGETILLAGGAISIDRILKMRSGTYSREESFVFKDSSLRRATWGIRTLDIVVTHNAPSQFAPKEMSRLVSEFAEKDSLLIADVRRDRSSHSKLMNGLIKQGLKPKFWFYGHFHVSDQGVYEGITYRIINSNEFVEYKKISPI